VGGFQGLKKCSTAVNREYSCQIWYEIVVTGFTDHVRRVIANVKCHHAKSELTDITFFVIRDGRFPSHWCM